MSDFMKLVEGMRTLQKEYFRTRSRDVLERSKQLERQVDAEIEKAKQGNQQTLFD